MGVRRPLFEAVRRTLIDFGEGDAAANRQSEAPVPASATKLEIGDGLEEVRRRVESVTRAGFPLLSKIAAKISDPIARSTRSALVLLCGQFGTGYDANRFDAAAAVELASLAQTVFLDVSDEPDGVGRRPTQSDGVTKWGNVFAVMAGNYLLTKSYELAMQLGQTVAAHMSRTSAQISAGRVRELASVGRLDITESRYVEIIGMETGSLYELACVLGSSLACAEAPVVEALARYGNDLGTANRLLQDALDVLNDTPDTPCHPIASVLDCGLINMPIVLSLRSSPDGELVTLLDRYRSGGIGIKPVLTHLRGNGSVRRTLLSAADFAGCAISHLEGLAPEFPRLALLSLAEIILDRVKSKLR